MSISQLISAILAPSDLLILKALAIYIVADALLTALLSIRIKGYGSENLYPFNLGSLGSYAYKFGGPYFGLALLAVLGKQDDAVHALFLVSVAAYSVSEVADLKNKVQDFFGAGTTVPLSGIKENPPAA